MFAIVRPAMHDVCAMMLNECNPGDLVAFVWPRGSDYGEGPFSDRALCGEVVIVRYGGPSGSPASGKKKDRGNGTQPAACVTICDRETHEEITAAFRIVANVEIEAVVQAHESHVSRKQDIANEREGDANDPMARQ